MKIRSGFVSNSSSSSFLIYGADLNEEQVKKVIEAHGKVYNEEDSYENEEIIDTILSDNGYKIKRIYTQEYYEDLLLGRSWSSVGDSETGKQFKENIEAELKKLTGEDIKCCTSEDAWRDG